MASDAKGKRKVFFTIGGRGLKPDVDVRNVSGGRFTKKVRKMKALRAHPYLVNVKKEDVVPLKAWNENLK
jgi:hypothetical protein